MTEQNTQEERMAVFGDEPRDDVSALRRAVNEMEAAHRRREPIEVPPPNRVDMNAGATMAWEGPAVNHVGMAVNQPGGNQPLTIGPIGSRCAMLNVYFRAPSIGARLLDGPHVTTGCFSGPLSVFEAKVKEIHGDNRYGQEYAAAIALIRALAAVYA